MVKALEHEKMKLVKLGIKEPLLNKLKEDQIREIIAFTMDHSKASNLSQMLIQLATMEANGKLGAAYLASRNLATTVQLKNLAPKQIEEIIDDYKFHQDDSLTIKMVKQKIIESQQNKLSLHGYEALDIKEIAEDAKESN